MTTPSWARGKETGAWCATRFDERGSRARASERTQSEYAVYDPGTRCPLYRADRLAPMRPLLLMTAIAAADETGPSVADMSVAPQSDRGAARRKLRRS